MHESTQLVLDSFINYIKNINLHFQLLLVQNQNDFKNITNKTKKLVTDFDRFVGEYNHKILQQIKSAKLTVPLIFYRTIKDRINDHELMKFTYKCYELKYIIVKINLQCHMHVQIVKNKSDFKISNIVFQKYQNTFTYLLEKIMEKTDSQISLDFFKKYALIFLEQMSKILNGENLCKRCRKNYSYQPQSKILMPPTIRTEQLKQKQRQPVYVHEQCLIDRPKQFSLPENY